MFQNARRVHLLVGGAIGLNLILGAGIAMGVVPKAATPENAASVRADVQTVATEATPATTAAIAAEQAPATTAAPETTVPPTTAAPATTATPKVTSAPTTAAPVVTAPPTTAPPTTPPPTAAQPATAPRTNPTDAQVTAAMQQIKAQIPLLPVNVAYGRQFGDAVCSAFDQGNNFAQVKNMVMQAVSQIPLIKITTANADFAVRTAVSLFCPAYSSKLV